MNWVGGEREAAGKQRYTAHKIHQLLQQEGYRGSESSLRHHV
ncbi:MAG: hypothetical protein R3A44_00625 [Caldilineaceae bacterium]